MTNALVGAKPEQLCHHHAAIPVVACVISKKRNKRNNFSRVESFFAKSAFFAYSAYSAFPQNKTEYPYLPKAKHILTARNRRGCVFLVLCDRPKSLFRPRHKRLHTECSKAWYRWRNNKRFCREDSTSNLPKWLNIFK